MLRILHRANIPLRALLHSGGHKIPHKLSGVRVRAESSRVFFAYNCVGGEGMLERADYNRLSAEIAD